MITPDGSSIPGQTMINDPLQLQFMTGGQMGYMPQAQFLTPPQLGNFRTLPTPDLAGNVVQNYGMIRNFLTANRGGPFGLPAFTFNTYNPSISSRQQLIYAQRRMDDTTGSLAGMAGDMALGSLATAVMGGPLGLAFSFFGPSIADAINARQESTRSIQNQTTMKIFGGSDVDRSLGYGFNFRAARSLDKYIREAAADDALFKDGDYREMMTLGMQYGQFDYSNTAEQYKRTMKTLRNTMTTMMEVLGSTDFKDIMENMKRMQDMGAQIGQYQQIARREQGLARVLGMSHQEAVNTYGQSGALIYQQSGLNAMQGSIQSMSNAAGITYMQRLGMIDPVTLAKYGGVSGMAQAMTQQDAMVQNSFKDMILPALMNGNFTGLRTDIDPVALMQNPNALYRLIGQSGARIRSSDDIMAYQAHSHKAYTDLQERFGGADFLEAAMAQRAGEMYGYRGEAAMRLGLSLGGMDPETAWNKTQAFYSGAAQEAAKRTQDEARQKARDERALRNSPFKKLERAWERLSTGTGELLFRWKQNLWGTDERNTANRTGTTLPGFHPEGDIGSAAAGMGPNVRSETEAELLPLLNQSTGFNRDTADAVFRAMGHAVWEETGKGDVYAAMGRTTTGGVGALQLRSTDIRKFFNGKGARWKNDFFSKISDEEMRLIEQNEDNKYLGPLKDKANAPGATQADKDKYRSEKMAYDAAMERLNRAWNGVAYQEGFYETYADVIMTGAHQNLNTASKSHGGELSEKISMMRNDAGALLTILPIANQFGGPSTYEILKRAVGGMSKEELARALKTKDIGLQERIYDAVHAYAAATGKTKILGRYDRNSKSSGFGMLKTNLGNIRNSSASGYAGAALSEISLRVGETGLFKGYTQDEDDDLNRTFGNIKRRKDCSQYVHDVINQYIEANGGMVVDSDETRELNRMFVKADRSAVSGEEYAALRAAGGGEFAVNAKGGLSIEQMRNQLIDNGLHEGSILTLSDQAYKRDGSPYNTGYIKHIAIVAKDKNGNYVVRHSTGTTKRSGIGYETISLDQFLQNTKTGSHKTILMTDATKAIRVKGGPGSTNAPQGMTPAEYRERKAKAAKEASDNIRELYGKDVKDYHTGFFPLINRNMKVGTAISLANVALDTDDDSYVSKIDVGYINESMADALKASGKYDESRFEGLDENHLRPYLERYGGNLKDIENFGFLKYDGSTPYKPEERYLDNGFFMATRDMLVSEYGLDENTAKLRAQEMLDSPYYRQALQKFYFGNKLEGYEALRVELDKVAIGVNGRTANDMSAEEKKKMGETLRISMFGQSEMGSALPHKKIEDEELGNIYAAAVNLRDKVEGKGYTAGVAAMNVGNVYTLLQDRENARNLLYDKDANLTADERKELENLDKLYTQQLEKVADLYKFNDETRRKFIHGENGYTTADLQSQLFNKETGLSNYNEIEALRKYSLEKTKDDKSLLLSDHAHLSNALLEMKSRAKGREETGALEGIGQQRLRDLGDTKTIMGMYNIVASQYGVSAETLQNFWDDKKVTDKDRRYALARFREGKNATEKSREFADKLEESWRNKTPLSVESFYDSVSAMGFTPEKPGETPISGDAADAATARQNATFKMYALSQQGGGSGMLSEKAQQGLEKLPDILTHIDETLNRLDTHLEGSTRKDSLPDNGAGKK